MSTRNCTGGDDRVARVSAGRRTATVRNGTHMQLQGARPRCMARDALAPLKQGNKPMTPPPRADAVCEMTRGWDTETLLAHHRAMQKMVGALAVEC
jgi:hypothetical protein